MATAPAKKPQEFVFEWEGKDRNGKIMRGEMRAGGEAFFVFVGLQYDIKHVFGS